MSGITLSAGIRQNVLSLQSTADLLNTTQNRLATGKKVNSAFDNPTAFFTSQSLTNRSNSLSALLDQIGHAQQTLQLANQGLTSITSLLQQALSVAQQALQSAGPSTLSYGATTVNGSLASSETFGAATGSTTLASNGSTAANSLTIGTSGSTGATEILRELSLTAGTTNGTVFSGKSATRATLQTNFNNLLTQIDQLAGEPSYNGVNLLKGDNLQVVFNENNTAPLTIQGVTYNSAGLGLNAITGIGFQANSNINATITAINIALSNVQAQTETFATNASTIQVRQDFTKNLINTLTTGSDQLVRADQNQESANLLNLQTRQQLSISALSISNQAQQAVLKLFP
jgi:flagellin-like hook-associated protein FlgL